MERNRALDGIRGMAALGVFAFHCWLYTLPTVFSSMPSNPGTIFLHELRVGWVLFFVLSGFVLYRPWIAARLDGRKLPHLGTFALRRVARVFPAYYLAILGSILLLWRLGATPGLRLPDPQHLYLFGLFGQNFTPGTVMKLDPPAWTIAIEVSFYAILPVLGWLALRGRGRGKTGLITVPLVLIALGTLWNQIGYSDVLGLVWTKTLPAVIAYFAVGMVAAVCIHDRKLQPRQGFALIAVGVGLILANGVLHGIAGTGGPALMPVAAGDLLAAVGFGILIACAWVNVRGTAWLGCRPLSGMGTVSYAFYLWHVPILIWLRAYGLLPLSAVGAIVVVLPIALVFANISWRFIERPILARTHRARPKIRPVPALPTTTRGGRGQLEEGMVSLTSAPSGSTSRISTRPP